jgi:hypothetical protein
MIALNGGPDFDIAIFCLSCIVCRTNSISFINNQRGRGRSDGI